MLLKLKKEEPKAVWTWEVGCHRLQWAVIWAVIWAELLRISDQHLKQVVKHLYHRLLRAVTRLSHRYKSLQYLYR
jgi:hypothetical protein